MNSTLLQTLATQVAGEAEATEVVAKVDAAFTRALAEADGIHALHVAQADADPFTRSSFTNSIAGKIERLALAGDVDLVTKAIVHLLEYCKAHEKPCFTARHKVWAFPDLARESAQKHDAALDKEPEVIAKGEGVEIVVNPQADRVQIVFAAKPSIEMIGKLKAEAWNWSRTEGAWQRKITEAAKASAKRIVGIS